MILSVVAMHAGLAAQAQSVAGEGSFAANFVGYAEDSVPPVAIGPARFAGIVNSTLTTMNAENARFLDHQTGRCLGIWETDEAAGTFQEHVRCAYTDADGDQIFERADFDEQPLEGDNVGTGRWVGGTGKYAGLSGVFEIRVRVLRSAREGIVQYVGTKQGRFGLPENETSSR
ncbi:hypothetical protein [Amaricoccus solimangrovi]|uniref:Uncharacterized protein n=1 Tax=Amaricoccus solimangrovi TaxID=2589815 RepID=A0A501WI43_9RHOB|nr:hypothetical protein [Amaricoccus solimangrovi]TPE46777.1 hypothetical protein FJM51_21385 [Amaricoccus solimangrovi]